MIGPSQEPKNCISIYEVIEEFEYWILDDKIIVLLCVFFSYDNGIFKGMQIVFLSMTSLNILEKPTELFIYENI